MKVHSDTHISDEDLLKALDGEQSARRSAEIRTHLTQCWECRARSSEIERAIQEFVIAYSRDLNPDVPKATGPRALLKARLTDCAAAEDGSRMRRLHALFFDRRIIQSAFAFGFIGLAFLAARGGLHRADADRVRYIPNARWTPGLTRAVTREQLCSGNMEGHGQSIPPALAQRVFQEYGIDSPPPRAYEVDYLITPDLGGADDIRNMWPEPYSGTEWNAHIKDALEDRLHQMVCDRSLELSAAQEALAGDWVRAYQKYFHVDHPLPEHLAFLKDRPWE